MKNQVKLLIGLALGTLALVGCGGAGNGSSQSTGNFPSGIYVVQKSSSGITSMSDMWGADWRRMNIAQNVPGMAFDSKGRLYTVNSEDHTISRYDDVNSLTGKAFGGYGFGANQFNRPTSVMIDSEDRIYVADMMNYRIVRMDDITGKNWTTLNISGYVSSSAGEIDLAMDSFGRIYFSSKVDAKIVRFDSFAGNNPFQYGDNYSADLSDPSDIFVDAQNRIYIADTGHHRILRIDDMSGNGDVEFGTLGSGAHQFNDPLSIFVSPNGTITVGDGENNRLVQFSDMQGAGWSTVGTYGTGMGQFTGFDDIVIK
jgi:streptogramin lyase